MKRIAMATVAICFIAVMQLMGQTTATTTATSTSNAAAKSASNSTSKPAANSPATPAANSAATAKPALKAVIYWDGTGKWERTDGAADKPGVEKWPSETYDSPQSRAERRQELEASGQVTNGEFETGSQGGGLKCRGPEKRPCSEGEVREMSRRMAEKSAEHPALASINSLTLESSEGALACRQVDGQPCTREQLRSLNEHVAEPLRCSIYEAVVRPNPQSNASTAQNEAPANSSDFSMTPGTDSVAQGSAYTTNAPAKPNTVSATPNSSATSKSSTSTQNHSMAQNHPGDRAQWQHRPPASQNRNSTPQNHPAATSTQTAAPPKQQ